MGEDEFLVPKRSVFGDAGSSDSRLRQQPGLRKLLQPLAVALGIFGVSAGAARYLFPRKKIQPQQQQLLQTSGQHDMLYGGDSSPTTAECTTSEQIVMKGADLTSYFSLEHGGTPVFGAAEHETLYNGYRFWFASEENKAKFEVRNMAYSVCRRYVSMYVLLCIRCSAASTPRPNRDASRREMRAQGAGGIYSATDNEK